MKKCCHCELLRPLTEFYKRKKSPDGFAYLCKMCVKDYSNDIIQEKILRICSLPGCEETFQAKQNRTIFCSPSHYKKGVELGITERIDLKDDPRKEQIRAFEWDNESVYV